MESHDINCRTTDLALRTYLVTKDGFWSCEGSQFLHRVSSKRLFSPFTLPSYEIGKVITFYVASWK